MKRKTVLGLMAGLTMTALLGACTTATSPATGRTFTTSLSPQQEAQLGRQEHPQILAEFGGAYDAQPDLTAYVTSVGQSVAATAERKDVTYTFTILDTPDVNAFAVPGGYVYITRGLLALANNEAEIAGVLGHEIGHINARHTAERMGQEQKAQIGVLGATLLGAILGGETGANLLGGAVQQGAQYRLAHYSQEQEFEADSLGVRYLKRSAYDPQAMATFLADLRSQSQLEAQLAGQDPNAVDADNMLASHPRTVDRVQRAIAEAGSEPAAGAKLDADTYLQKIDGLIFGDDPRNGIIDGTRFIHPSLHFAFTVPQGYKLVNQPDMVGATGPQDAVITFTLASPQPSGALADYIASGQIAQNVTFQNVQAVTINGMPAATGTAAVNTNKGSRNVRVVLVKHPEGRVYQFLFFATPNTASSLDSAFLQTAQSFQQIGGDEGARYRPKRVHIVTVQEGDTVQSLSARMVTGANEDWFRVLNNLKPGEEPQVGRKVKIVTY
ncbi:M48 family metalloprotease [Dongia soli]|uniref:M48 family metalloprotease n=1 Tax=Dongia soli TaxID=600628 RepID=A0ABU5E7D0_9PROT|nr:M48 family metalloprotease [Dongia soli]MDY0882195.1 M48 family metalloprotease [Dongia soli]